MRKQWEGGEEKKPWTRGDRGKRGRSNGRDRKTSTGISSGGVGGMGIERS